MIQECVVLVESSCGERERESWKSCDPPLLKSGGAVHGRCWETSYWEYWLIDELIIKMFVMSNVCTKGWGEVQWRRQMIRGGCIFWVACGENLGRNGREESEKRGETTLDNQHKWTVKGTYIQLVRFVYAPIFLGFFWVTTTFASGAVGREDRPFAMYYGVSWAAFVAGIAYGIKMFGRLFCDRPRLSHVKLTSHW